MQRNRNRGGFSSLASTVKWWYVTSGGSTVITNGPTTYTAPDVSGEYEEMRDYVTPNFRERLERGDIINNEMSKILTKKLTGDAGWKFSKVVSGTTYYGEADKNWMTVSYGHPQHLHNLPSYEWLHSEVSTRAWSKVLQPTAQLLVTGAEMGKTLRMLRSPLNQLTRAIWKSITGGRKGRSYGELSPKEARNLFSNSWLELRYGWRPLMLEIDNILEALNKQAQERYTARSRLQTSDTVSLNAVGANAGISIPYTIQTKRDVRVSAGILYQHEIPLLEYVWGTRLSDIPLAAWDLVPYSFVVDWLVNVNTFIQAIVPKGEVKYLATWTKEEIDTSTLRSTGSATFSDWNTLRSPSAREVLRTESRRRVPGVAGPSLTIRYDSIKGIFTDFRGLDSLTLLSQKLRF